MRARNREITIFNLSMLDVISGAMAAFLIILVVLMPYYRKTHIDYQAMLSTLRDQLIETNARAEQAAARTSAAQAEAQAAQREAAAQQQRADGLARQLAKTFLVLYVRWDTLDDVDLHVVDPSGAEFSFDRKRIAGRAGELSEDTINGPGNEVWEIRDAPPGDYRIEVVLFGVKDRRKPVLVAGRVFHRDGSNAFDTVRLTHAGERASLAKIQVAADGAVALR